MPTCAAQPAFPSECWGIDTKNTTRNVTMHTPNFDLPSSIYQSEENPFCCHMQKRFHSIAAYQPPAIQWGNRSRSQGSHKHQAVFPHSCLRGQSRWDLYLHPRAGSFFYTTFKTTIFIGGCICLSEKSGVTFSGMSDIQYRFYHVQLLYKLLGSFLQRVCSPMERDVSGI